MRIDYSTLKKVAKEFGHDFQIEAGFEPGTSDLIYMLRFGYWGQVDIVRLKTIFEPLFFTVASSEWEDDDCGWLYCYYIKKK